MSRVDQLLSALQDAADVEGLSGVVRVDRPGLPPLRAAYGLADRAHQVAMSTEHRLGTASITKGLTATSVVSLIADGALSLTTPARSVLGPDLPLIRDDVTVEHLLSHTSGIGDYLDESTIEDVADHVMPVPVHRLATTEDYLAILDGHPTVSAPGERFSYNNGAFVVLAVIAERVAGMPFPDLVTARVCDKAGMTATRFLRTDEVPGSVATGYLHPTGLRTNLLHLPVRGSGDGGSVTTVDDLHAFWTALVGGALVDERWLAEMRRPRHEPTASRPGYGLGLWLHSGGALELHGYDAGVSGRSVHDPVDGTTWTVLSNSSTGSRPFERVLATRLPTLTGGI